MPDQMANWNTEVQHNPLTSAHHAGSATCRSGTSQITGL